MKTKSKQIKSPFVEWVEKMTLWLVYSSVVIIPLIFLPFVESVFSVPKLYIFHILTLIIILLWGIKCILQKEWNVRRTRFIWVLVAYAFISIVNSIFTINIWSSLFGTYGRFVGLITITNLLLWVYILINELNTREKIRQLLWLSVSAAFSVSIYGILQHQDLWVNVFTWSQDPLDRVFTTIGHSNHTAAYLGMNLMILIGLFVSAKSGWRKFVLLIMGMTFFLTIIMTASRGGIAAIFVALLLWFLYALRDKEFSGQVHKYSKVFLFIFAVLILAAGVFRHQISELSVVKRSLSTIEFVQDGNIPDRVSWWMSTAEMIKDKPILGHGLSTYRDVYNLYRRADYKVADDAQDHITPESAHMEYMHIWAMQGIVGLVIYLLMIWMVFAYGMRFIKQTKERKDRQIVGSLLAGITVYLVQVLVSFGVVATLFMLYTFIGLVVAYTLNTHNKSIKKVKLHLILRVVLAFLALIIFVAGMYYSFSFLASQYHIKQANVLGARNRFEESLDNYEKAISFMPTLSAYHEEYADYLFETGLKMPENSQTIFLIDALDLYEKAINLNPNLPYVYVNKGLVLSRLTVLNEYDGMYMQATFDVHEEATKLSRNNPVYHYKYGKQLLFFGYNADAVMEFERVREIRDPYKDTADLIDAAI